MFATGKRGACARAPAEKTNFGALDDSSLLSHPRVEFSSKGRGPSLLRRCLSRRAGCSAAPRACAPHAPPHPLLGRALAYAIPILRAPHNAESAPFREPSYKRAQAVLSSLPYLRPSTLGKHTLTVDRDRHRQGRREGGDTAWRIPDALNARAGALADNHGRSDVECTISAANRR